jgi:hypothetical protein
LENKANVCTILSSENIRQRRTLGDETSYRRKPEEERGRRRREEGRGGEKDERMKKKARRKEGMRREGEEEDERGGGGEGGRGEEERRRRGGGEEERTRGRKAGGEERRRGEEEETRRGGEKEKEEEKRNLANHEAQRANDPNGAPESSCDSGTKHRNKLARILRETYGKHQPTPRNPWSDNKKEWNMARAKTAMPRIKHLSIQRGRSLPNPID